MFIALLWANPKGFVHNRVFCLFLLIVMYIQVKLYVHYTNHILHVHYTNVTFCLYFSLYTFV